uniref:Uncharacterized protein n=1 Tax=Caenorhabditis japonica TaxID=281687 RepID=A0A8R1DL46_CAEJA
MGLIFSLVQSYLGGTSVEKPKHPDDTSRIMLGPTIVAKPWTSKSDVSSNMSGGFKYLKADGPPQLGPSKDNKPAPNPIAGVPTIKPPEDTETEILGNPSVYDTISMAPEVDWEKKQISAASSSSSSTSSEQKKPVT